MSGLMEKQGVFMKTLAELVLYAYDLGYIITGGELWRPPEMIMIYAQRGTGSINSVHGLRLAQDINLWIPMFENGHLVDMLKAKRADYEKLGVWWEEHGGAWGGRFKKNGMPWWDNGHFSFEHGGVK